ncbi:MAG: nickel pincer cofactor biosynthesis protein LarC, partial [Actinomycetia bacterium]|nr:nickel pincer cofactor biosynthesis protein LarC [Actinomycetes bacterium]
MSERGRRRQLWLDPGFGASGDMMLGALIGLGASADAIRTSLAGLGIDGWELSVGPTKRATISATRAQVTTEETHPHRSWSAIESLLATADLPARVSEGSRRTFELLGRAEAAVHQVDIDDVHFHEVGAIDAIVDIVGSWAALDQLSIEQVTVGPIGLGHGRVTAAHGSLPLPAPATLTILEGAAVRSIDTEAETVTPTGAALLVSMATGWGPIPTGQIRTSARGAGGRDPATHPNVLTAVVIESAPSKERAPSSDSGWPTDGPHRMEAVVLATNLDDVTPEIIGHAIERLVEGGADDAWVVPAVMKKGRPGHELRVLGAPARADELRALMFSLTGSLGIRTEQVAKHVLDRSTRTVEVRGHRVAIKDGPYG